MLRARSLLTNYFSVISMDSANNKADTNLLSYVHSRHSIGRPCKARRLWKPCRYRKKRRLCVSSSRWASMMRWLFSSTAPCQCHRSHPSSNNIQLQINFPVGHYCRVDSGTYHCAAGDDAVRVQLRNQKINLNRHFKLKWDAYHTHFLDLNGATALVDIGVLNSNEIIHLLKFSSIITQTIGFGNKRAINASCHHLSSQFVNLILQRFRRSAAFHVIYVEIVTTNQSSVKMMIHIKSLRIRWVDYTFAELKIHPAEGNSKAFIFNTILFLVQTRQLNQRITQLKKQRLIYKRFFKTYSVLIM